MNAAANAPRAAAPAPEPMNVMYCGDGYIEPGVLLSALSLTRHALRPLHVFVLTARVGEKEPVSSHFANHLDALLRARDPQGACTLIDATDAFASQPPTANMGTRFTPCCMLRLYADLVEGLPDRLLYLDNDVVCLADPTELYDTSLDGAEFAGVLDYYGRFFFRRRILHMDYMNSGVLLMDLARMRETGLLAACRARCASEKMFMPDQTSLNELAQAKRILPRRFNDQRRTHQDTVMRHYSNCFGFFPPRLISVKPWDIDRMHDVLGAHELDDLYEEFEQEWGACVQRAVCRPEQSRAQDDKPAEGPARSDCPLRTTNLRKEPA